MSDEQDTQKSTAAASEVDAVVMLEINKEKLIDYFEDLIWKCSHGDLGLGLDWDQANEKSVFMVDDFIKNFQA